MSSLETPAKTLAVFEQYEETKVPIKHGGNITHIYIERESQTVNAGPTVLTINLEIILLPIISPCWQLENTKLNES